MAHSHSHSTRSDDPEIRRLEQRALGLMMSFLVPISVLTVAALLCL